MTRLVDLEPQFVRIVEEPREHNYATMPTRTDEEMAAWVAAGQPVRTCVEPTEVHQHVETLTEANGITFLCPACRNHHVGPTFASRGVADHLGSQDKNGKPSRWSVTGTGYGDLTLQPSIDLSGPGGPACQWHGWVRNGDAS